VVTFIHVKFRAFTNLASAQSFSHLPCLMA